MRKQELLLALQGEIRRHDFSHFTEANVTVPGCRTCKKRIQTMHMFTEHLCLDVLPPLLDRLSKPDTTGG
jgi:hypothetical protein